MLQGPKNCQKEEKNGKRTNKIKEEKSRKEKEQRNKQNKKLRNKQKE